MKNLNDYCTLGRTGLKVSPLGLGVMTYGWGADKKAAREIRNSIIFLNQQCKR